MNAARFEVVHTRPYKFHARFVAANGETVWVTESYRRRRDAIRAVKLIIDASQVVSTIVRPVDERDR